MSRERLIAEAEEFLAAEWPAVRSDLERLVSIDSSQDLSLACEGAPFGPGPRAALDEAFAIAREYGFEPHECAGVCGYFDVAGAGSKQLGIIGHLDVVPAGDGWTFEPFAVTEKCGYLVGRGVTDDKGPLLMALHALRFWRDRFAREGVQLPVTVRMIFGCAEETGMEDADYYIEHIGAPDFLFTPDADFPLCYGEKGQFQLRMRSARIEGGRIDQLAGGTAKNGVPGSAYAVVNGVDGELAAGHGIETEALGAGCVRVSAAGTAGHAAMPDGALNAVGLLAGYLLRQGLCTDDERAWLGFVADAACCHDGSRLGIACEDDDFGQLTCVGSVASFEGGVFSQAVDVRFPTTTSAAQLERVFAGRAAALGATLEVENAVDPLLVPVDSPEVAALGSAYEQVTGREAKPFTMGGGTYAHHFPRAVSFGAMDEERFPAPDWLGGMHAADEGVAQECLKQALLIYIVALGKLFELDWS